MLSSGAKDSGGNRFRFFPGASGFLPGRCRGLVGRRYAENGGETTVLRRFESSPVRDRQLSGKSNRKWQQTVQIRHQCTCKVQFMAGVCVQGGSPGTGEKSREAYAEWLFSQRPGLRKRQHRAGNRRGREETALRFLGSGRALSFPKRRKAFVPVSGVGKPGRASMKKERRT